MEMKSTATGVPSPVLSSAMLLAGQYAWAEDQLAPALLTSGEQSLQSLIQFPDWRGDMVISILCGARLAADGDFLDSHCWGFDNRKYTFIRKSQEITDDARAIPARLNGEIMAVWM